MHVGPVDEHALVVRTEQVAAATYRTRLQSPQIAAQVQPGQFVQVRVGVGVAPLLRLPLSVAGADPDTGCFELIYASVGPKTELLARTREQARLACLGPLGCGFRAPPDGRTALLVGGGTGLPPLVFLGQRLRAAGQAAVLLAGARTAAKHLPDALLAAVSSRLERSTDDGTCGHAGLVTELLDAELDHVDACAVYGCGPSAMLREVAAGCRSRGIPCQVSLEEYMACGIGICMGCVVAVSSPEAASEYDRYQRVCVRGPVFDAAAVDWDRHG